MSEEVKQPTMIEELTPGLELTGTVKRIELYGAFVDVGVGTDGLLHISQLGKPNVRNVEDVVKPGQQVTVYVLRVDQSARKIALSLEKPASVGWDAITVGSTVTGKVTKLESFGAFVDIGAERLAMIHVSELASGYVKSPSDVVKVGDEVTAEVIKVDPRKKRIDLSIKALEQQEEKERVKEARQSTREEAEEDNEPVPSAMALALQRAMAESGVPMPEKRGKKNSRGKQERREREQRDLEDIYERTLRGNR